MPPRFAAAAAAAALTAAASAQTAPPPALEIYGVVDVAVERVDHVGAARTAITREPSLTGSVPSRLGIRGGEALGGGLRAVFNLEQGIGPDTGGLGQGGRAWGRQAWVGVAGPWGTVALGRQYTMLFWALLDADVLGPNVHSSGSLDPYIPNARTDNAIGWRGRFGGWTAGATGSFGRDAVDARNPAGTNCPGETASARTCREWSALLKYDAPAWGMAAAVDELRGGPGAFAGLTDPALADRRTTLNGWARVGDVKLGGGLLRRDNDATPAARRSDLWFAGAVVPLGGQLTLDVEAFQLRRDAGGADDRATLLAARATWGLSKRTAVYASAGHVDNDGTSAQSVSAGAAGAAPRPGGAQTGVAAGLRHAF